MELGLLHSLIGARVKEPVVLFQSDDWGFNRVGSQAALKEYCGGNGELLKGNMALKDALETEEDVLLLKDVLTEGGVRGAGENAAVFTCNAVMANPNFEEILRVGGEYFVAEDVRESYQKVYGHGVGGFSTLVEGNQQGIFDIQFHAWVHLQYGAWLQALRAQDTEVLRGAELGICGVSSSWAKRKLGRSNFLAALDWQPTDEGYSQLLESWKLAFSGFEEVWGKQATSFMAPAYIWSEEVEAMLLNQGLLSVQGLPYQLTPKGSGKFGRKYRRMRKNSSGVQYTLRNCYFEPGENYSRDYVSECLQRMKTLISWRVPVIINTHRFNYMGGIDVDHRAHGLNELTRLIASIRKQWPEARFIGTKEIVNYL